MKAITRERVKVAIGCLFALDVSIGLFIGISPYLTLILVSAVLALFRKT